MSTFLGDDDYLNVSFENIKTLITRKNWNGHGNLEADIITQMLDTREFANFAADKALNSPIARLAANAVKGYMDFHDDTLIKAELEVIKKLNKMENSTSTVEKVIGKTTTKIINLFF